MRIAIVNDLRIAQEVLRKAVAQLPNATVAWTALDGAEAIEKCRADRPGLILMDMVMPRMDGAVATRAIMKECPCPVLVVTSTIEGNLSLVYEALSAGALDAVQTPTLTPDGKVTGVDALARKVQVAIAAVAGKGVAPNTAAASRPSTRSVPAPLTTPILAIGASTGGPHALSVVLRDLRDTAHFCTIIVQHIDVTYAPGLAQWLAGEINRPVQVAQEGDVPRAGAILVASTSDHLVLAGGVLRYVAEPIGQVYRPSVDVFFDSLCREGVESSVAVLLTGMGRDGAAGMRTLRDAGWHTIAQDHATSVVWGMPGAAVELGGASAIVPLGSIGAAASDELALRASRAAQR